MHQDRQPIQDLVVMWKIPHTTIAEISSVHRSEVSRYINDQTVSTNDRVRIEQTVREIAEFVSIFQGQTGMRPDLSDISNLRVGIEAVREWRTEQQIKQDVAEAAQMFTQGGAQ